MKARSSLLATVRCASGAGGRLPAPRLSAATLGAGHLRSGRTATATLARCSLRPSHQPWQLSSVLLPRRDFTASAAPSSGQPEGEATSPALIKETSELFYQQLFVAKDEKAAFHLYKILNSLTRNRAFAVEFGQHEGGRAIDQLFRLFREAATTHYSQEKILAVLTNLARHDATQRRAIAVSGAEPLRQALVCKTTLRGVVAQAVQLLNVTLQSKAELPSSLFEGYVPATMDLMVDFADKPELQLDLIHLLGLLSTDCGFEDYKKLSPLGAAMLIRNMQAYIFEPQSDSFIARQMTETLQALHRILSRRPAGGEHSEEESKLAQAFQNTFLEHDSKARYAVLNGLNCVVLLTKSTNPTVSSLATEVVELLGRDNPGVFAEVAKIRSSQE